MPDHFYIGDWQVNPPDTADAPTPHERELDRLDMLVRERDAEIIRLRAIVVDLGIDPDTGGRVVELVRVSDSTDASANDVEF